MVHQAGVYIRFPWQYYNEKFVFPLDRMPVHRRLLHSTNLYSCVERSSYDKLLCSRTQVLRLSRLGFEPTLYKWQILSPSPLTAGPRHPHWDTTLTTRIERLMAQGFPYWRWIKAIHFSILLTTVIKAAVRQSDAYQKAFFISGDRFKFERNDINTTNAWFALICLLLQSNREHV